MNTEDESVVLQRESEAPTVYKDDSREPYFTTEQLANWCHMTAFEDHDSSTEENGKARRRIKPPKRRKIVLQANSTIMLEHKGWPYYIFWYIVVLAIEIPLHIIYWKNDNAQSSNKLAMLGINFFVTCFSRTVWFKWLIYLATLPTYYLPANPLKMAINKTVVNNGGIHTATAWVLLFDWIYLVGQGIHDGAGGTTRQTYHFFVASSTLMVLMAIIFFALPWRDSRTFHELFEFSHRYGGWLIACLFLSDILISLLKGGDEIYQEDDLGAGFALAGIFLLVYPWLGILKAYKAPSHMFAPSNMVVLVSMPKIWFAVGGTAGQLAYGDDAVGEYHSFACLSDLNGDSTKTTMGIARAGDWTSRLIDNTMNQQEEQQQEETVHVDKEYKSSEPNSRICFNRVAAPGFMWLVRNYKRVVCIGTGAGIAPISSFLPKPPCEMMVLWFGRKFEETYGPLYNFVAGYHNSILIDTRELPSESNPYAPVSTVETHLNQSTREKIRISEKVVRRHTEVRFGLKRPDLPALAKAAVELFNAEAVFIISGPKPTFDVCHEMWRVGVHAYGATWDS